MPLEAPAMDVKDFDIGVVASWFADLVIGGVSPLSVAKMAFSLIQVIIAS